MATAHDVAAKILQMTGTISAMKLQKLVYYSQAWATVWDDSPIFAEPIEAWANGPVVPDLYAVHKGEFLVTRWPYGDPGALSPSHDATVNAVVGHYGKYNAQQLSDLTHSESPWIEARKGIPPGERSSSVISLASLSEYYSSL